MAHCGMKHIELDTDTFEIYFSYFKKRDNDEIHAIKM